jgi:hypothetical protein
MRGPDESVNINESLKPDELRDVGTRLRRLRVALKMPDPHQRISFDIREAIKTDATRLIAEKLRAEGFIIMYEWADPETNAWRVEAEIKALLPIDNESVFAPKPPKPEEEDRGWMKIRPVFLVILVWLASMEVARFLKWILQ